MTRDDLVKEHLSLERNLSYLQVRGFHILLPAFSRNKIALKMGNW